MHILNRHKQCTLHSVFDSVVIPHMCAGFNTKYETLGLFNNVNLPTVLSM